MLKAIPAHLQYPVAKAILSRLTTCVFSQAENWGRFLRATRYNYCLLYKCKTFKSKPSLKIAKRHVPSQKLGSSGFLIPSLYLSQFSSKSAVLSFLLWNTCTFNLTRRNIATRTSQQIRQPNVTLRQRTLVGISDIRDIKRRIMADPLKFRLCHPRSLKMT